MPGKLRTRTNGTTGDSYLYIEDSTGVSLAVGSDGGTHTFNINTSASPNVSPDEATSNIAIDPTANGDIAISPNGTGLTDIVNGDLRVATGDVNVILGDVNVSAGDVNIDGGDLNMVATNNAGSIGCITSGGERVISFPDDWNVYIGKGVGGVGTFPNVLNTGYNVAIGAEGTLNSMQGSCNNNIAIGRQVLNDLVGDPLNITPAQANIAIGSTSLSQLTNGSNNIAIGVGSLGSVLTGSNNICIAGGGNYTGAESANICIGTSGTLGDNNIMRLGDTFPGSINETYIAGIHGVTPGGASQQLMIIDADGQIGSTSSGGSFATNTFHTDSGDAVSSGGAITIAGGLNLATSGSSSTVTVAMDNISGVTPTGTLQTVLVNSSGELGSAVSSSVGAYRLLQTAPASTSSSLVLSTGVSSVYGSYYISFTNIVYSTAGTVNFQIEYSVDGTNWLNSGYSCGNNRNNYSSATITNTNSTSIGPLCVTTGTADHTVSGYLFVYGLGSSSTCSYTGQMYAETNHTWCYGFNTTTGIVALRFSFASGTMTTGSISMYGILA